MTTSMLFTLSAITALVGTLGGIGGATLLVPVLILGHVPPIEAAPLGLLAVASGSLAAAPRQARSGLVHHRLGVVIEIAASAGGIIGALVAGAIPPAVVGLVLGGVSLGAAVAGGARSGMRNLPDGTFVAETPGEWPGTLAGQYVTETGVVPYRARRVGAGVALSGVAGLVSGISGVGGGFIKVPTMSEVMGVPVKVAAATSTFTIAMTAAVGLIVHAAEGRVDPGRVGPVVIGGLIGGLLGARTQHLLPPVAARRVTAALLGVVGIVVIVRSLT